MYVAYLKFEPGVRLTTENLLEVEKTPSCFGQKSVMRIFLPRTSFVCSRNMLIMNYASILPKTGQRLELTRRFDNFFHISQMLVIMTIFTNPAMENRDQQNCNLLIDIVQIEACSLTNILIKSNSNKCFWNKKKSGYYAYTGEVTFYNLTFYRKAVDLTHTIRYTVSIQYCTVLNR